MQRGPAGDGEHDTIRTHNGTSKRRMVIQPAHKVLKHGPAKPPPMGCRRIARAMTMKLRRQPLGI